MSAHVTIAGGGAEESRPVARSMGRGLMLRCPACGEGRLFRAYLKVVDACENCGEELHHQRADDAPPYVVITIVAHVVVAGLLAVEVAYKPEVWVHLVLWMPLTIILSLALLPPVKGALVGLQWALRMHGFGGEDDSAHLADGGLKPERRP
ncbi:DUF983 domain-containing protein [Methylopila sp. Yamaguchi]|uniref:DUF983 domain-containing protein n=1 Tax=Methylopila sp. Yamaguchi TaxID=1437817 RepID=UPI000CB31529|nr:DUF983 domain-containing protein [Methylopila sp. Yamaguchi]GBD48184.1 hypothetical protein METY_1397 [Methylopila sp. Yamaguchi]